MTKWCRTLKRELCLFLLKNDDIMWRILQWGKYFNWVDGKETLVINFKSFYFAHNFFAISVITLTPSFACKRPLAKPWTAFRKFKHQREAQWFFLLHFQSFIFFETRSCFLEIEFLCLFKLTLSNSIFYHLWTERFERILSLKFKKRRETIQNRRYFIDWILGVARKV